MEHLIINLVVSELILTCFFLEINDTYFYSDPLSLFISVPLILAA
jgi:hypothetical protein